MIAWCRIKKRKGNAVLKGHDLGCESPLVQVTVLREEELRLPKPSFKRAVVKAK